MGTAKNLFTNAGRSYTLPEFLVSRLLVETRVVYQQFKDLNRSPSTSDKGWQSTHLKIFTLF